MRELKMLGFWRSKNEPLLPDPAKFIDDLWDKKERLIVSRYLKSAQILSASPGSSWCRFRCKRKHVGSVTYTDGKYVWPEGLAHYVDVHFIRLPDEFIEHAIHNEKLYVDPPYDEIIFNKDWWINQKGWNDSESFLTPGFCGELWLRLPAVSISQEVIKFLRSFHYFSAKSTRETLEVLKSEGRILISEEIAYCDFYDIHEKAAKLGIQVDYVEVE